MRSGCLLGRAAGADFSQLRVVYFYTIRAEAMCESGVGMLGNIAVHLAPVVFVIADFLAPGADGDQAAEGLDVGQRLPQFCHELLAFQGIPDRTDPADSR